MGYEAAPTWGNWLRAIAIGRRPKWTLVRIATLLVITFVAFKFVFLLRKVESISMLPTFREGHINLINRLAYTNGRQPRRGDIVAVRTSGTTVMYIKRVIGLPGESVLLRRGAVYIDGEKLDEPYLKLPPKNWTRASRLGPDEYFIIGDNRSMPTRVWRRGRPADRRQDCLLNRRRAILLVLLLALVGGGAAFWIWNDPRQREIKRVQHRLLDLAKDASFSEKDPLFKRLGYPQRVVAFFDENIEVAVEGARQEHRVMGRAQLLENATQLRAGFRGLSVQFLDPQVELAEDLRSAVVHLTSKIYFTGDSDYTVQEFRIALVKQGNAWMVRKVETVKTMH